MVAKISNDPVSGKTRRVVCAAPAKINLALHVTGMREDGYHTLDSLVVFCDIGDKVSVKFSGASAEEEIGVFATGPFADDLPIGADNIVHQSASAFAAAANWRSENIAIFIEKNLPIASGIGGGSADAAATLLALANLTGKQDVTDLTALSEIIGSDVPMCLRSETLIARGRGEHIQAIENFPKLHLLLVNPGIGVSTPKVFSALKTKANKALSPLPEPITHAAFTRWLSRQRNDLQKPAEEIAPQIKDVLYALSKTDAQLVRMSGAGATCFGIYDSANKAQAAAMQISEKHPNWWVKATATANHGFFRAKEDNA